MTAIVTKFLPETNSRGAQIKATWRDVNFKIDWDYALDIRENHLKCAIALAKAVVNKMGSNAKFDLVSDTLDKGNVKWVHIVGVATT